MKARLILEVMKMETNFLTKAAAEAYKLNMEIKHLTEKRDALMEVLKVDAAGVETTWGSYKLSFTLRTGAVDYSRIPVLKEIDLEQYRRSMMNLSLILNILHLVRQQQNILKETTRMFILHLC